MATPRARPGTTHESDGESASPLAHAAGSRATAAPARGTRESDLRLFELSRGEADIAVRTAQPNHPG